MEVGMEDITDDEWMKRMMRNMDKMAISLKDLSLEDWMRLTMNMHQDTMKMLHVESKKVEKQIMNQETQMEQMNDQRMVM